MSESAKIVGFDRRNIALHVGDTIQDALGRKFTIIGEDGEIEGEAVGQLGYLQDLNGAERLGPAPIKEPAQVPESLRGLHAYDDPKTEKKAVAPKETKPREQAGKKVAAPYRGGRKNHSGLVRVGNIAKAVGYNLGNGTAVLREAGLEIVKDPVTGTPCVRIQDKDAARELLASLVPPAGAVMIDDARVEIPAEATEAVPSFVGPKAAPTFEEIEAIVEAEKSRGYNEDVARKAREAATPKEPTAPSVDYDALKDQGILIHPSNCAGPSGCLEGPEALDLFSAEDLVRELRRRGWEVSCTKSI